MKNNEEADEEALTPNPSPIHPMIQAAGCYTLSLVLY